VVALEKKYLHNMYVFKNFMLTVPWILILYIW
jgi:hypothetical protein